MIQFVMNLYKCFFILFLAGKFECKQSCGSAADGALNFMSLVGELYERFFPQEDACEIPVPN